MSLYDKALDLEVEPLDNLGFRNPSIVNKGVEGISGGAFLPESWKLNPKMQEFVGDYAPNGLNDKYLQRENITSGDLNDLNEVQYRNQTTGEA